MTVSSSVGCGENNFTIENAVINISICATGINVPVHKQAWGNLQTLKWGKFSSLQWGRF